MGLYRRRLGRPTATHDGQSRRCVCGTFALVHATIVPGKTTSIGIARAFVRAGWTESTR
jgi:hypothetical protein